ncbi:MAG: RNA pyrophosphohydrolase [Succinivibrionaceae bacterium]
MIDREGYRYNVGMVICNSNFQVLWARRVGQNSWQFPQGGIDHGESPEDAMYRELYEEMGLKKDDVTVLDQTRYWIKYRLPKRLVHKDTIPACIGQKQKWFLLMLKDHREDAIRFDKCHKAEFDSWRWVTFWYPVRQVIPFKRDVYRKILRDFSWSLMGNRPKRDFYRHY